MARLATVGHDGAPHLVPVTFALEGDTVWWAVDAKPKRTASLRRLSNISAHPRVTLLVDEYHEDWSRLWWVRADGVAERADGVDAAHGVARLVARYDAYRAAPPSGPVVKTTVLRWRWWSAS